MYLSKPKKADERNKKMSAANFKSDEVLGIVALNTIQFNDDEFMKEVLYQDFKDDLHRFNQDNDYIKLDLEAGHYESASLKIDSFKGYTLDDYDLKSMIKARNNKKALTDLCRWLEAYAYGISPKKIFEEYERTITFINYHITRGDLLNLNIAYQFSNGETGYSISNELLKA